jgi:phosphopantetheinyl transferase
MTSTTKSCTMLVVSTAIHTFYYTGPYTSALMPDAEEVRQRLAPVRRDRLDRQIAITQRAVSLAAWRLLELSMHRLGMAEFRLADVIHPVDGKPHWVNSQGIDFNISHARGMAFCAIAKEATVGCDAEDRARLDESLTKRILAADATRVPCWTEIESIVKAAGKGIMHGAEIVWRPDGGEFDGQSWWCYAINDSATHAMHVAANKPKLELITTEVVDL